MSPIGKIFLLINFGLAFGFLFWASTAVSANEKWKQQFNDEVALHAATKTEMRTQVSDLQIQLNSERTAKDQRVVERDQAQAESSRNREDLDAEKRANEQLRADVASISETLNGYRTTIDSITAAKDAAVEDARGQERERNAAQESAQTSQDAQRNAEDALRTAQGQIADLERELTGATDQVARLDTQLTTVLAKTGVTIDELTVQPNIETRVLQVDTSIAPGLVALNAGSADGVRRGMTFEIFKGNSYKGRVRVENVHENMCSGLILGTPKMAIGQGDSAATNL